MIKSILIFLFLFILSCSSDDNDEYINDQSIYENNNLKDYELFKKANNFISSELTGLLYCMLPKVYLQEHI